MVPIFMIGTQRSGSNLLRLMLNQLTEISSPHPAHIFERMIPLMDNYGNLDIPENFAQLVDDVCKLIELNPVTWEDVNFDRKEIIARCKGTKCLAAVYGACYDIYAEAHNASTWCCKSLVNINYIDIIEDYFVEPKYIYLYRDGRDVALSFQKAVVGEKHIYNIAMDWTRTQEKAIKLINKIGRKRVFCVSYEELINDTRDVAQNLCKFLGVKYTESMLDYYKTSEAKNAANSSKLWKNVTSPIMANNSGKYKTQMPEDDLRIFESIAGNVLDKLGYKRELVQKGEEELFSKADIEYFNHLNSMKKSEISTLVDPNDIKRRNRQSHLLNEIKSRIGSRLFST